MDRVTQKAGAAPKLKGGPGVRKGGKAAVFLEGESGEGNVGIKYDESGQRSAIS